MRKRLQLISGLSDERGATAIIIGLLMVVFIGLAAVAVDIGYAMVTRNELQNISDGAALAATGWLGDNYSDMSTNELFNYVVDGDDEAFIKDIAKDVAGQNQAGGVGNIILNDADIVIGQWHQDDDPPFTPTLEQPDAVRVTARRDVSANGPINTFFARIFGQDVVSINTFATAALTGVDEIDECELFWPVGISAAWFDFYNNDRDQWCDQDIKMYPTGTIEGCAGWHTFNDWPANANTLRQILEDGISAVCQDEYGTGDEIVFTGGTVASVFDEMKALWDFSRVLNDGEIDLDDDDETWTTHVVIYDLHDCSNPGGYLAIIGFATVQIYQILEAPDKIINARVVCLGYGEGRGGGGSEFGTMGTIPGLVQ
jgi:hypothetical protein